MNRRVLIGVAAAAATLAVSALAPAGSSTADPRVAADLRINEFQVIGSHNSYHIEPPQAVIDIMIGFRPDAYTLQYTHAPLPEQLDNQEVRQFELDVFADPDGNVWRPEGVKGWKVFHIEQVDMDSTCLTLLDCLNQVKGWSDIHRDHMPISILLEVKDSADIPGPADPVPVTEELLADMDAEIRSVFPPDRLITPDDVRGSHATLEEAVLTDGWPTIESSRGKVMFLLDNRRDQYLSGTTTLEGRVAFTPSSPGQPDAAFLKLNDPIADFDAIQSAVEAGYVVRTRADNPVDTAKSGDTTQRDAALASGAQWVSTDYPIPGLADRWGTSYYADIPGGVPARCNPINAPVGCENAQIETLAPAAPAPSSSTSTTAAITSTTAAPASTSAPRFTG